MSFGMGFPLPATAWQGGGGPSLNLDFINSSTLPGSVTFSRGTQAMQYGSDGTLQYAPNNLLTYSNQADNAAWTKSNSFVQTNLLLYSQDYTNVSWSTNLATTTVNSVIATNTTGAHSLIKNITLTANKHTLSATVSYSNWQYVILKMYDGAIDVFASFDILNGSVGAVSGCTSTITNVGNGRYRITITHNAAPATIGGNVAVTFGTAAVFATASTANPSVATTGVETINVWNMQLVQGSVPGDYVATTSAALPVLYADYNGALRARKLCEDATASVTHRILPGTALTIDAAGTYTYSWYVKAGELTEARLTDNNVLGATFNLTTGASSSVSSGYTASSVSLSNGWWRLIISGAAVTANGRILIYLSKAGSTTYTGDGSSGIYIADAQLTPGYLPLAVTETTSAAVYGPRFDYDPSSLVAQNLLLQSQTFSSGSWTKQTGTTVTAVLVTAPNSTLTGQQISWGATATGQGIYQSSIAVSGTNPNTKSIYVRADAAGGTVELADPSTTLGTTLLTLSTSWQRVSLSETQATGLAGVWLRKTASTPALVYIWGAQLNQGSTALPYTATTTAPYTLCALRGLLIEEQRANLLLQSNDFQTSWTPTNITRTLNSTLSPEGVVNGVKIEATTATTATLYQTAIVAATSATGSVYVKQGTGATTANSFVLRNFTSSTNLIAGTLNYSTGVWAYSIGSTGVVVTNIGNGWWRLQISATSGITSSDSMGLYIGFTGGAFAAGDFIYAYGAQLEAGAFATSYIPTTTVAVTRNADSASITTLTPWYNTVAGTWYAAFQTTWDGNADQARAVITGDANANKRYLYIGVSQSAINSYDGTTILNPASGDVTGTAAKVASTYNATARTITNNAVAVASGAVAAGYAASSSVVIGQLASGNYLCGWVSAVRYYPTALSNASLQSITT